ncbi:MAG: hypothetical protein KAG98_07255 [Lentisphaeria bacterium]|nr:hypothetical protein [Lentisphaeria bacterium]
MTTEFKQEAEQLRMELEQFKKEKESIRQLIGQIGGKNDKKVEKFIDVFALGAVLLLFIGDMIGQFMDKPIIPHTVSLELGILLVSLKIIWMMYRQSKVEHFQFWILNSIEFRVNDLAKELRLLRKKMENDK